MGNNNNEFHPSVYLFGPFRGEQTAVWLAATRRLLQICVAITFNVCSQTTLLYSCRRKLRGRQRNASRPFSDLTLAELRQFRGLRRSSNNSWYKLTANIDAWVRYIHLARQVSAGLPVDATLLDGFDPAGSEIRTRSSIDQRPTTSVYF